MAAATPHNRLTTLLSQALPLLNSSHPAYQLIQEASSLATGLEPYLENVSSDLIIPREHSTSRDQVKEVWQDLLKATMQEDWAKRHQDGETKWRLNSGMCSGNYEATVLQNIALATKATRVLEIGTFTGTMALALALLPQVTEVFALDIEPFIEKFDRPFWERAGVSSKIRTIIGPAKESLLSMSSERAAPFDLVFIDADKPSYATYVKVVLEHGLLSPGGVIIADNTLYKGLPWTSWERTASEIERTTNTNNQSIDEATRGIISFNNYVKDHPELIVSVLPIRDGVSIIQRTV